MYITCEQHTKLAQGLFDKMIELRKAGVRKIRDYEIAFQDVIEEVFVGKRWYHVTKYNIFMHLKEHRDPKVTIIAILKELYEN